MSDEREYVIWSFEHRTWWRPNKCGYTTRLDDAGRYTKDEAGDIATSSVWCEEVAMLVAVAEQNGHPEYSPWGGEDE